MTMIRGTENTPSDYTLQYESHDEVNDTCLPPVKARESTTMPREENEGVRLDRVLAAHSMNRARLAKKAGVAASTVQKWYLSLTKGDIRPASWNSLARALSAAGIDPKEVRPHAEVPTKTNMAKLIDPLMEITDRETLTLILDILELEDNSDREALLAIVRFKLK